MNFSQRFWHARQRLRRQWRTLRHDGLAAAWQAGSERFQAWYMGVRRSKGHEFVFPFVEVRSALIVNIPHVSLIIPVCNGLSYVQQCIAAIYGHQPSVDFEVVVVDQASTDGSREYLQQVAAEHTNFHLIENPVNVGFPRAINQGAAYARGEFLLLVNSDVILAPQCVDRLVRALEADPQLAVVSPVTNYVGRGPQVDPAATALQPTQIADYAASIADRSGIQLIVDHLVFYCVMVRRHVFEFLNGMSEVYGLGNYEDNDFCLRARLAGYTLALVPGAFAFHFGSRTFKGQQLAHTYWMQRNERLYFERVSYLSGASPFPQRSVHLNIPPRLTVAVDARADPVMLLRTLNSLAHQTVTCFEVVLVGAADVIETAMERFTGALSITVCGKPQAEESSRAWNYAHTLARGDWLVCLRAGDVLYPTHIEMLLSLTNSDTFVVSTQVNAILCVSEQGEITTMARAPYVKGVFDPRLIWAEAILPAPAFAYRRSCLAEVGEFDVGKEPLADWDFLLRLAARYPLSWTDTITAECGLYMGSLIEVARDLPRIAEKYKIALQTAYACHPAPDVSAQKWRSQVSADWEQKLVDLKWLATQEWKTFSLACQMALVWLNIGE